MTNIAPIFKNLDKYMIGYDDFNNRIQHIFQEVEGATKYPPYNIIKGNDNNFAVELAVAGFAREDINIQVDDTKITIKGETSSKDEDYLYKGLASRSFTRVFPKAETMEVIGANLKNGILRIDLQNVIPEAKKAIEISID